MRNSRREAMRGIGGSIGGSGETGDWLTLMRLEVRWGGNSKLKAGGMDASW